jgi:FkbM family methyltransferase
MIAQTAYDILNRTNSLGVSGLFLKLLPLYFRRVFHPGKLYDYELLGAKIKLPGSHELPILRVVFSEYSSNLARIARQVVQKYPALHIVDIGANVGDSAAILRSAVNAPILSIEGREEFYSLLTQNAASLGNVTCVHSLVSEKAEERSGQLVERYGTAVFVEEHDGPAAPVRSLLQILESSGEFNTSKLIKIDTDGFDCAILRGAMDWLARMRPVIFFEFDPASLTAQGEKGYEIFDQLRAAGYAAALIYHNSGEFIFGTKLDSHDLFVDWYEFLVRKRAAMYCDVCAFSAEDLDLYEKMRGAERAFFNKTMNDAGGEIAAGPA